MKKHSFISVDVCSIMKIAEFSICEASEQESQSFTLMFENGFRINPRLSVAADLMGRPSLERIQAFNLLIKDECVRVRSSVLALGRHEEEIRLIAQILDLALDGEKGKFQFGEVTPGMKAIHTILWEQTLTYLQKFMPIEDVDEAVETFVFRHLKAPARTSGELYQFDDSKPEY